MSCEACGNEAPTMFVTFKSNIGLLILRQEKTFACNACKRCIKKNFWDMQTTNLVAGWWGTISMIITPIYLVTNWVEYAKTSNLPDTGFIPRAPRPELPFLTEADHAQLAPHASEIHELLLRAMTDEDIAFNLAPNIGLPENKVQLFVAMMRQRGPEAAGAPPPPPVPTRVAFPKYDEGPDIAARKAAAKARRDAEMERVAQRARQQGM